MFERGDKVAVRINDEYLRAVVGTGAGKSRNVHVGDKMLEGIPTKSIVLEPCKAVLEICVRDLCVGD